MGFSRQEYWSGLPLPSLQKAHKDGLNATRPLKHENRLEVNGPQKKIHNVGFTVLLQTRPTLLRHFLGSLLVGEDWLASPMTSS